jgi:aspartyl-tRNA(Asn)/glutamyl-tRNA(Gln) amidotransferase subunit A
MDIYTTSANLAGIPGISIPVAKSSKGLPIGLQLLANQFNEPDLLKMSYYIQEKIL